MMFSNNFVFSLLTKVYQTPIYLATTISTLLLLYFYEDILLFIKQWKFLSRIPGPPRIFPVGTVYCYHRKDKRIPQYAVSLDTFNGLCKLFFKEAIISLWFYWRGVVVVFRAEEVQAVLTNPTEINKDTKYRFLIPWLSDGLLLSIGSKWKHRRKLITPSFHFNILEQFLPLINYHSNTLIKKLSECQEAVDISPLITRCTLDVISETAMGIKINAQDKPDSEYVKAIHYMGESLNIRVMNFFNWFDFIFYRREAGKKYKESLKIVHEFTRNIIKDRKNEMIQNKKTGENAAQEDETLGIKKRKAFLDYLLEENLKDENKIDVKGIEEEVDTFMFAGHDTTAVSIVWALYMLGLHPEAQEKVHEELNEVFGSDTNREITNEDISKMKFLECCIKESMRVIPTVMFIGRHLIKDTKIGNYTIPKGTGLNVSFYMLHRDPEQFPQPEKYIPERFLPENSIKRHPFAFVPFSGGPRNCIGQRYAWLEMKVIITNILRNFRIKSVNQIDEIIYAAEMVTRPKVPIQINFTKK